MKKNLAPLVGIAFVVAIISTGIFYGLFVKPMGAGQSGPAPAVVVVAARDLPRGSTVAPADVKLSALAGERVPAGSLQRPEQSKGMTLTTDLRAGEPITESHLASAGTGAGAGLGVPAGMRAVSVYVNETNGVLAMLKPGHRVDVQVVKQRGEEMELRAILDNIQVLNSQAHNDGRNVTSVVTLLATPSEADMLALADSGARVRLLLRNPLDEQRSSRSGWVMSQLLRSSLAARNSAPPRISAAPEVRRETISVRVAAATPSAIQALSGLNAAEASGGRRVAPLRSGWQEALAELERNRQLEVLSSTEVSGDQRKRFETELQLAGSKSFLITGIGGDLVMLVTAVTR